jgi:hypothetical protein
MSVKVSVEVVINVGVVVNVCIVIAVDFATATRMPALRRQAGCGLRGHAFAIVIQYVSMSISGSANSTLRFTIYANASSKSPRSRCRYSLCLHWQAHACA